MSEEVEKVKIVSLWDPKTEKEEKYMLSLKVLGQGKYGKVYRAVHIERHDQEYAVKVIRLDSEKVRQDCLKELQIIKHLPNSLHLVKIHPQHLESENHFYIFEEYCDGGTLFDLKMARKGERFSEEEVFNLFYQITKGFLELRKAGIFHEDIKPQNILIKNNVYKLTDFGISQIAGKHQISSVRKGTLLYMPPEKLKLTKYTPTSKSQIFSLGVTFYEIIFGHPPYVPKRPNDYKEYLKMLQEAELRPLHKLREYFPNPSLSIDKLLRTIIKMIDLSEAKRLSLEELESYVTQNEPFKSIKIQEYSGYQEKRPNKKFQAVGYSKVYMKTSTPTNGILELSKNPDPSFMTESFKMILNLFREISTFLQQGTAYAKNCKLSEFHKNYEQETEVDIAEYLQFLLAVVNDTVFQEIAKMINNFLLNCENEVEHISYQSDIDFVKNELLKIFLQIRLSNKKQVLQRLRQEDSAIHQAIQICFQAYEETNCVRVNFKEDILALLFAKDSLEVMKYIDSFTISIRKGVGISELIKNEEIERIQGIARNFCRKEAMRKEQLSEVFKEIKAEKEILEDDESNSDEFELLEDIEE